MRFVLAALAFVAAMVLIGTGIAQRTVLAPPDRIVADVSVAGHPDYLLLPGSTLNAHPGRQTLVLEGSKDPFVAYGRTADVKAWLDGLDYAKLGYDADTDALTAKPVKSTPTPEANPSDEGSSGGDDADGDDTSADDSPPDPRGSDLWLQEFSGDEAAITTLTIPEGVSVLIAGDGTDPAPSSVRVVWPSNDRMPWSGPLLVGGLILLVVALLLLLWAILRYRRARGPRRKGPKMPRLPRAPRYTPTGTITRAGHGRRSIRRFVAVTGLVTAAGLTLSACSSQYWPDFSDGTPAATPTPLESPASGSASDAPPAAVTAPQAKEILSRIADVAAAADKSLDAKKLKQRFDGPAYAIRAADYAIRSKLKKYPMPAPIPDSSPAVLLPQATAEWPRVVALEVKPPSGEKSSSLMLFLQQDSPRSNYHVRYAVSLNGDATVPELAPAAVGAPVLPPDSKLLTMAPEDVGPAYADLLLKGDKSTFVDDFADDDLRPQVGVEFKKKQKKKIESTASLSFSNAAGEASPIAIATNNSGALVVADFTETETVKPTEDGAEVFNGEAGKALSGIKSSTKGLKSTYGYQVLFYVPPAGSSERIELLGYTTGMISSSEVK